MEFLLALWAFFLKTVVLISAHPFELFLVAMLTVSLAIGVAVSGRNR